MKERNPTTTSSWSYMYYSLFETVFIGSMWLRFIDFVRVKSTYLANFYVYILFSTGYVSLMKAYSCICLCVGSFVNLNRTWTECRCKVRPGLLSCWTFAYSFFLSSYCLKFLFSLSGMVLDVSPMYIMFLSFQPPSIHLKL